MNRLQQRRARFWIASDSFFGSSCGSVQGSRQPAVALQDKTTCHHSSKHVGQKATTGRHIFHWGTDDRLDCFCIWRSTTVQRRNTCANPMSLERSVSSQSPFLLVFRFSFLVGQREQRKMGMGKCNAGFCWIRLTRNFKRITASFASCILPCLDGQN